MSINHNLSPDNTEVVITVSDRFDFSCQKDFRDSYKSYAGSGKRFVVDLAGVSYMDSSALGMLLMLREHANTTKDNLVLRSASTSLKKILSIANFERMFTIH